MIPCQQAWQVQFWYVYSGMHGQKSYGHNMRVATLWWYGSIHASPRTFQGDVQELPTTVMRCVRKGGGGHLVADDTSIGGEVGVLLHGASEYHHRQHLTTANLKGQRQHVTTPHERVKCSLFRDAACTWWDGLSLAGGWPRGSWHAGRARIHGFGRACGIRPRGSPSAHHGVQHRAAALGPCMLQAR